MIAFDLCCSIGHTFEGWFEDSASFDYQSENGLIACPVCDDKNVKKLLSPVVIRKNSGSGAIPSPQVSLEESIKALEQIGRQLKDFVEKNFEDVGTDFTREALKMHYGVSEPRNIRGISSESDEEVMKKEGIAFFKLPAPAKKEDGSDD